MRHDSFLTRSAGLAVALVFFIVATTIALAQQQGADGWVVKPTHYHFSDLITRLDEAVKAHQMNVVNFASASEGARAAGIVIPGNRVVGVFRNDFARRLLPMNLRAGIEAPIRFYLTEDADGLSTLSYRTPSSIFAAYVAASAPELRDLAKELDEIFAAIAVDATAQ